MRRPLFVIGTSFAVATWVAFMLGVRFSLIFSFIAFILGCFVLVLGKSKLHGIAFALLTAGLAFCTVCVYFTRTILPIVKLAGSEQVIEGVVLQAQNYSTHASYTVKANFVEHEKLGNTTIIINSFGEMSQLAGDVIRCKISLTSSADTRSYGYYRSVGVWVLGGVQDSDIENITTAQYLPERFIIRLRQSLRGNLYSHLSSKNASVLSAMVLGFSEDIAPATYAAVNKSGTAHLLSVSGLHLSILIGVLLKLFDKSRLPRWLSSVIIFTCGCIFSLLVGFGASVVRSLIMTGLMLFGRALSRRADSTNTLGLSMLIICAAFPQWVLGRGLWLSFGATLGIIKFNSHSMRPIYKRIRTRNKRFNVVLRQLLDSFAISISAYTFTFPLLVVFSGWVSLVSPLTNMLVTPFISISLLGGMLLAGVSSQWFVTRIIAWVVELSTTIIIGVSGIFAKLSFAIITLDEFYMLVWLVCTVVMLFIAIKLKQRRVISLVLAFSILLYSCGYLSHLQAVSGRIELVTIQGSSGAILLRGQEAVLLGTPKFYEASRIIKYLDFRGVKRISSIIAADCGERIGTGPADIATVIPIQSVVGPDDGFILELLEYSLPNSVVYAGGYATVELLGGAIITTSRDNGDITVKINDKTIFKTTIKYDIIGAELDSLFYINDDGIVIYPQKATVVFSPIGRLVYGETRFLL